MPDLFEEKPRSGVNRAEGSVNNGSSMVWIFFLSERGGIGGS